MHLLQPDLQNQSLQSYIAQLLKKEKIADVCLVYQRVRISDAKIYN